MVEGIATMDCSETTIGANVVFYKVLGRTLAKSYIHATGIRLNQVWHSPL